LLKAIVQANLGPLQLACSVLYTLLQAAAIFMLFRPDARAWFAAKGKLIDAHIFD